MWEPIDMVAEERRADLLREAAQTTRLRIAGAPHQSSAGLKAGVSTSIQEARRHSGRAMVRLGTMLVGDPGLRHPGHGSVTAATNATGARR